MGKHHHDHGDDHGHDHSHHPTVDENNSTKVKYVLILTASFMFVEFAFGYIANSLALMADSGHMLTDVAALALTLLAFSMARRPANDRNTFGFYRMEILAAFINGILLAVIAIGIVIHAVERIAEPQEVNASQVIVVGLIGLAVNIFSGVILLQGDRNNLNMRGALFHVFGDALASVGTVVASLLIMWKGWLWADPIVSGLIALIIIFSAYRLIADTVHVILQGVPVNVDMSEIRKALCNLEGVSEIHNLHVWSLSSKAVILTVHLVSSPTTSPRLLERAKTLLSQRFKILHSTIQVEEKSLKDEEPSF